MRTAMSVQEIPKNRILSALKMITGWVVFLILTAGVLILTSDRSTPMPPHAKVVADDNKKTYSAPPYFDDNEVQKPIGSRIITAHEAGQINYNPDDECRNQSYFKQENGSWIASMFTKPNKRWNEDGSWNY